MEYLATALAPRGTAGGGDERAQLVGLQPEGHSRPADLFSRDQVFGRRRELYIDRSVGLARVHDIEVRLAVKLLLAYANERLARLGRHVAKHHGRMNGTSTSSDPYVPISNPPLLITSTS